MKLHMIKIFKLERNYELNIYTKGLVERTEQEKNMQKHVSGICQKWKLYANVYFKKNIVRNHFH